MSILSDYEEKVELEEERHIAALDELRKELKENQKKCKNHQFVRYEELFYALGETYPGLACSECGLEKRI